MPCPTPPNQVAIDQSKFWDSHGIHWGAHRIGWTIAGGCAIFVCYFSSTWTIIILTAYALDCQRLDNNHFLDFNSTTLPVL